MFTDTPSRIYSRFDIDFKGVLQIGVLDERPQRAVLIPQIAGRNSITVAGAASTLRPRVPIENVLGSAGRHVAKQAFRSESQAGHQC
jgi:hypothetical protein